MGTLKPYVVIPNWNGVKYLPGCLDSLLKQTVEVNIVVVENGSKDGSLELLKARYPEVEVLELSKNHGFAGGVNVGIKKAMADGAEFVALLNNDAIADKNWIKNLLEAMKRRPQAGIVTSKITDREKGWLDSSEEQYSIWGLPFSKGRGERISDKYNKEGWIFGASGGASLYRVSMLKEIGLFDEDFFAYYEDVDLSFRAQLAGWKVAYAPEAVVYHEIGATSRRIKGFTTYQTLKNLPQLMWKNVPLKLMFKVFPRFVFAYFMIWGSAIARGQIGPSTKGVLMSIIFWPKKLAQRYKIQKNRKVSADYINSIITHDLPPNAHNLRRLRGFWGKILGKKSG
jgi:GT2 family glycosyltransferase